MAIIGIGKLEIFLNLTKQRIGQLVDQGMPKEGRGRYDALRCVHWYIRYLQKAIERRTMTSPNGESTALGQEKVRFLRLSADLKEMELAKQQSQLIARSDVEKTVADLVLTTKAQIMAIPARLAPELVGETSRVMVQAKIEKAVREALTQLARSHRYGETAVTRT